jgi:hypothetical protein
MHNFKKIIILSVLLMTLGGCAYRHYLGIHGPSIQLTPDVHQDITEDQDCLDCHHPDRDPEGPATSHPQFTGCLKCHNDNSK